MRKFRRLFVREQLPDTFGKRAPFIVDQTARRAGDRRTGLLETHHEVLRSMRGPLGVVLEQKKHEFVNFC